MIKKIILIGIVCFLSSGCVSTEKVEKLYEKVNIFDGVSFEEAQVIAQMNIIDSRYKQGFDALHPQQVVGHGTEQYPNFWFFDFSPVISNPQQEHHIIVIDKRTGGIIFAKNWKPETVNSVQELFR